MKERVGRWLRRRLLVRMSAGFLPVGAFLRALVRHLEQVSSLQVGANDGLTADPVARFKRREHRHGICLEPQSGAFAQLGANCPEERRRLVNMELDTVDGHRTLPQLVISGSRWASGW
jgi:hypothetical protein